MPIVSINGVEKKYDAKDNDILFDALDNQGYQLPHGCLAGSCGACRIEVLEGKDNLVAPSAIEKNTIDAIKQNYVRIHGPGALDNREVRLSCRARVKGDITITPLK